MQIQKTLDQNDDIQKNNNNFDVPGTIYAIAASSNSSDTVLNIRIMESFIAEISSADDYGDVIVTGQSFIGNFLIKSRSNSKGDYFQRDS